MAKTARGFSNPGLMLIDEAAQVPDEVYSALRPMLATGDGALWLMSTPMGKRGFFWREWAHGGEEWLRLSVKATECPRIKPRFLEEERRRLSPREYAREYLCEFEDIAGALFRGEDLDTCSDDSIPELFAGDCFAGSRLRQAPKFYLGVDLGQSQDFSAVAVLERDEICAAGAGSEDVRVASGVAAGAGGACSN